MSENAYSPEGPAVQYVRANPFSTRRGASRLVKKSASLQRSLSATLARNERVSGRNTLARPLDLNSTYGLIVPL